MIITRTPYRLSFFGGGTDYPSWSAEHGGAVLGCSINKYCFISYRRMGPFFEHRNRIVYASTEYTDDINGIKHPGVRETLKYMQVKDGIEVHHVGDLPARSGTGSSSAFIVGLLNAVYASRGLAHSPRHIALEAYHIEREKAGEVVGYQDQVLTAHGGFRHVEFAGNDFKVHDAGISQARIDELMSHVILAFTGDTRMSSPIAASYIKKQAERAAETRRTYEMVSEALQVLRGDGDLRPLGALMHESWELKKARGTGVSTPHIDAIYAAARAAGATGGKVIGAGGAGFMMLLCDPADRTRVIAALDGCTVVDARYEPEGSKVVYCDEGWEPCDFQ